MLKCANVDKIGRYSVPQVERINQPNPVTECERNDSLPDFRE